MNILLDPVERAKIKFLNKFTEELIRSYGERFPPEKRVVNLKEIKVKMKDPLFKEM